jgi:hypothetical protein
MSTRPPKRSRLMRKREDLTHASDDETPSHVVYATSTTYSNNSRRHVLSTSEKMPQPRAASTSSTSAQPSITQDEGALPATSILDGFRTEFLGGLEILTTSCPTEDSEVSTCSHIATYMLSHPLL